MTKNSVTKIGLLRHGQTDWNVDFRLQGTTDIELNQVGIAQAELAAQNLNSEDWDAVVSSPLSRARVTAEIVAAKLSVSSVAIEPLLLERSFGEAEGLKFEDWKRDYPTGQVPGGESLEELAARAWLLLANLAEQHEGKRVLAVSHGALIRKLIKLVSGGELPREGERFQNASLSVVAFDGDQWIIDNYDPKSLGSN